MAKYNLTLVLGDDSYKSKGKTIVEALENPDHPQTATMGKLLCSNGKKEVEVLAYPRAHRSWKTNEYRRIYRAKGLHAMLDEPFPHE